MRNFILSSLMLLVLALFSTTAHADKTYANADLASDGIRLEAQVKNAGAALAGQPLDQLRAQAQTAIARGDAKNSLYWLSGMIAAKPDDSMSWLAYSRALTQSGKTDDIQKDATTAAYLAYAHATAKPDEAVALARLGEMFALRQDWRPSLNAYRASLDLVDDPIVRAVYQKERETYGFRILQYKVDKDSASPRACFQFSESLAHGRVDFAPFVSVAGMDTPAISTEDQQLCVEGLKHGEHYKIVLRQGLPSAVGEALLRNADYDIYVRDRSPQVHFTGKNYVLPRVGQEGIPVVSVNTQKIAITIIRVGDRNLLPTVRSQDFLAQLSAYRIKQYVDSDGKKIWSGSLAVKSQLNQDVTTAFPVLEALGKLDAGVYILTAKAADNGAAASDDEGGGTTATQWFVVSDLGLTAISGRDGVHVFVRSLTSAAPLSGISLRLVARDNEVLANETTGADGHVRFAPGLARGTGGQAPGIVVAEDGKGDYGFLDLQQTAFDLTDRGVKGRAAAQPLDADVFTERGVYRPGENVFVTALLRDDKGIAKTGLPLTLVIKRPDGVEYQRISTADQGAGGRAYTLPLLSGAARGTWRIEAYVDPKAPAVGETSFLVEDYVPERLDFTLKPAQQALPPGGTAVIDTVSRYLYGAPGAGLDISGEVRIEAASSAGLPALVGYQAGLTDETFVTVTKELEETVETDAKGAAQVSVPIPDLVASRPLEAKIILRAGEPGGRAVERSVILPILPKSGLIGVKKNFDNLGEGATATFDVIGVAADGKRMARKDVGWSLYRLSTDYQWYNQDGRWGYEKVKSSRRVADGKIDLGLERPAKIAAPVAFGSYRLDVTSSNPADAPTSISFVAGWSGDATAETPDVLDVTLDKTDYKQGDTMKLSIASRFSGTATIAILGDELHYSRLVDIKKGDTSVELPVGADWGTGAYAVVFAHRPLDQAQKRMPGRALGLAWFGIDRASHRLDVSLGVPEKIRPRQHWKIPVTLAGLAAGEEAYVTLAAVDVGILNLTQYTAPDPSAYFYGQRQLGTEIRDLYGLLIDGMQGTRGAIRSGGDAGAATEGNLPTQEPLALYSGIVKVGADGKAEVGFDLPAFNGSVRVMAVAWSKTKVGGASKDVIVRDPVVVQATLPRFLALGDRSQLTLDINNVEGAAGDYVVDVAAQGPIAIAANALHKRLKLATGQRRTLALPLTAAGIGRADLNIKLSGPNLAVAQDLAIKIEPGTSELYRRMVRPLPPGESVSLSSDLLAEFLPGTGRISVSVSPLTGINVAALLQALDRYPYGCSEQLVSRALPLLYVNKLASLESLAIDTGVAARVKQTIARLLARQDSNGTFGAWAASDSDDMWLHAYVTDFLTRAREQNYSVPQKAFDMALERLRNYVANTSQIEAGQAAPLAYAAYVLARNGRPVMSDLRYLADTQIASFDSPLSRAQLGAALALLGDRSRSAKVFIAADQSLTAERDSLISRADYGSRLRDGAGVLALAVEAGAGPAVIAQATHVVEDAQVAADTTSTQENAWMVLAAEALADKAAAIDISVDGMVRKGAFYHTWTAAVLAGKAAKITNQSPTPTQIVITTMGNPLVPEPAGSKGYEIERAYYTLAGDKLDPATIKQNDRFVVTLKVTETEAAFARLILTDPLPAGLEIDNPALFDGGAIEGLAWIKSDIQPAHTEYRDDRFVAAFNRDGTAKATFSLAYIVRAVTPGHYLLPAATIEDMYRPSRYGRTAFGHLDVAPK
ncbi:alpha-2-macroglobulin [Methylovirgula sp. HY1]|uniref:alpha-2-macroglobulin family protein n=1 Tax=Methylovirgula sp. HY1 TaxID=2822761 RepID=UPI001C5B222B|nr:alpha-2-macroglobulin [Methylovirgula sp. HY1]QXX76413.1 putative lipoprotein YfhM [Methylovirgula sp. HY1]